MIVQTPGVYITEKNNLASSVAGISTAVPAFIGFTEISQLNPIRIKSMFEFENHFGGNFTPQFAQSANPNQPIVPNKRFFLYDSLDLYFRNGGGPCYITCAGTYSTTDSQNITGLLNAALGQIDVLDEVTLLLMPDMHFQFNDGTGVLSSLTGNGDYSMLASSLLSKCAALKDKFALLDYLQPNSSPVDLRNWISAPVNELKYGALYYPWLKHARTIDVRYEQISLIHPTGSTQESAMNNVLADGVAMDLRLGGYKSVNELTNEFNNLSTDVSNKTKLTAVFNFLYQLVAGLDDRLILADAELDGHRNVLSTNSNFTKEVKNLFWFTTTLGSGSSGMLNQFPTNAVTPNSTWINFAFGNYANYTDLALDASNLGYIPPQSNSDVISDLLSGNFVKLNTIYAGIANFYEMANVRKMALENKIFIEDPIYAQLKMEVINYQKQIPSQGAIAGLYCKNDRERGVWKSPANMAVQGIEKPMFEVSNAEQDSLNVDAVSGKSINVIRTFTGKGALIWGARTLDGNSNEWRYIAVRRFFSFAEESVKKAMENFVFETNNARTWVKIKAMITSFLVDQWKSGALIGSTMNEAFFVNIGENTTSPSEILNGIINVQIGMAVARPAEFIILEFSHYTKS